MAEIREFITYTNWAMIDHEAKNGNSKPALELEFDDIYDAEHFTAAATRVAPIMTMFRTDNPKEAGKFEYNFPEKSFDYFFYGKALSGYAFDALNKYLKGQKYYGEFALYINSVSTSNLLFSGKVKLIETI